MPLTLRSVRPVRAVPLSRTPAGRWAPWRILLGFAVLLCALFAVSFGAGRLAGPVRTGPEHHGGGSMPGMAGMDMKGLGAVAPVRVAGVGR